MKQDILLVGIGGQGVLSAAALLSGAVIDAGYRVRQSELHGMAQRGGSVLASLRVSDRPIPADLIARGTADLILGTEPLEAARAIEYLAPTGWLVTSTNAVRNLEGYPDPDGLLSRLGALPRALLVDSAALAADAGQSQSGNIVMLGMSSALLPIRPELIEAALRRHFANKGGRIVNANLEAFRRGRLAARSAVP